MTTFEILPAASPVEWVIFGFIAANVLLSASYLLRSGLRKLTLAKAS